MEITAQTIEQKNEKRKRKKRIGKISNVEPPENLPQSEQQQEASLPEKSSINSQDTKPLREINDPKNLEEQNKEKSPNILSEKEEKHEELEQNNEKQKEEVIKEKDNKEVIEEEVIKEEDNKEENIKEDVIKDKIIKEKDNGEDNDKKEIDKNESESLPLKTMSEKIVNSPKDESSEKEKKILRGNMNKYLKRANVVDDEENEKSEDDGTIPSKDINPNELIEIDKDDGEVDYLKAQQAYELSVFLESHKFIINIDNFDKPFIELVKSKIIRFERNLIDLVKDGKFFLLYELQVNENTSLCLTDIATLNAIKSVFLSYPDLHLIIMLSDEEMLNKQKKVDYSLVKEYTEEKLANTLIYLNLGSDDQKRIHAFSTHFFKENNKEFENEKNEIKKLINKPRLRKLFSLTEKEEEKNDLLLDYPCCLAIASNPSIYTQYIPEITQEYRCLIINSIFFMNRYQLCFDASRILSFNEPAIIALKIIPPLQGFNGREAYCDLNEENTILSSDDQFTLTKKLNDLAYCEPEGKNPNIDIACHYLGFFEKSNKVYNNMIKRFKEGAINNNEVKDKVINLLKDSFLIFSEKNISDVDTDEIMIK